LVLVEVVLDDPPQAARPKQASNRPNATIAAIAVGLRLLLGVWDMRLLFDDRVAFVDASA
jgi:hypothetical protein